jgi:hypothetical protein
MREEEEAQLTVQLQAVDQWRVFIEARRECGQLRRVGPDRLNPVPRPLRSGLIASPLCGWMKCERGESLDGGDDTQRPPSQSCHTLETDCQPLQQRETGRGGEGRRSRSADRVGQDGQDGEDGQEGQEGPDGQDGQDEQDKRGRSRQKVSGGGGEALRLVLDGRRCGCRWTVTRW